LPRQSFLKAPAEPSPFLPRCPPSPPIPCSHFSCARTPNSAWEDPEGGRQALEGWDAPLGPPLRLGPGSASCWTRGAPGGGAVRTSSPSQAALPPTAFGWTHHRSSRRMMAYRYSLLVLWLQLDRAVLLSSNDPNVCSYWESFTTVSKESFVQPLVQESKEPCKSPAWLRAKTCPQYRVLYKTAYRQGVKVDYRRRHHCCEGFYESSNACVPRCAQECVHGRCVAPDQCQCEQGWRGSDCSSECSDRTWGPDCQSPCTCLNGGSCDPLTGACACPPGYRGQECQEPCATGTYGQGCQLDCHCQNGAGCSLVNGACLCSPGYAGPQ
ncbi:hypothetical protein E2320_014079, partial [Naja naja]